MCITNKVALEYSFPEISIHMSASGYVLYLIVDSYHSQISTYPIPLASRKARKNMKFGLKDDTSPQRALNNIADIRVRLLPSTSARLPHV